MRSNNAILFLCARSTKPATQLGIRVQYTKRFAILRTQTYATDIFSAFPYKKNEVKQYTNSVSHEYFMHRCLELAEKGRGLVGTNPLVGCVLVRTGEIIAEGYYRGPGTDHAERDLFKNFDQEIQPDDQLYVNLEPCCHQGKTPPCTSLLIEKEIKHVVVGMQDPDERVAGKGIEQLRAAGMRVTGPVLRERCERLNRGYISLRTKNRPYITLKRAQTREGLVANNDGTKLCITSDAQNAWAHTHLRTTCDAILVGVQTVITDDPQLTIRLRADRSLGEGLNTKIDHTFSQPYKVILDPNLRIPQDAKLIDSRTVIVTTSQGQVGDAVMVRMPNSDTFDWNMLWEACMNIGISSILVEGGPKTWKTFEEAGFVDEEVILVG